MSTEARVACANCQEVLYRPHMMDDRGWCPKCVKAEFFEVPGPPEVAAFAYWAHTHGYRPEPGRPEGPAAAREAWHALLAGYAFTLMVEQEDE